MTPPDSIPEPQDEAIGGLIERLTCGLQEMATRCYVGLELWDRFSNDVLQAASALSRLQVERDNWRMEYLEAVRGEEAAWAETEKLKQQLSSAQSQPCSETGPNSPSSPQTPFSDGGGES